MRGNKGAIGKVCLVLGALAATLGLSPTTAVAALREDIAVDVERSFVHQGLLAQGEKTAADHGDLDGDGRHEAVVTYRIKTSDDEVWGVLVVYGSFEAVYRERALLAWRGAWPVTVGLGMGQLQVGLRSGEGKSERSGEETLVWEKDLAFHRGREGKLLGVTPWASTSLKARRGKTSPPALIDGRLETGWAESALGTGISEQVRLSFEGATDLALLGVYGGNGASKEAYELSNRVGRAELRILTLSEEGDPAAGINYAAMGLAFSGQKDNFDFRDRPGLYFLPVNTTEVKHLELKIESVFLGDRYDDLWIAELVPVRLRATPTLELLQPPAPPRRPGAPRPTPIGVSLPKVTK